jgi:DNA-binding NtrC family response regulator
MTVTHGETLLLVDDDDDLRDALADSLRSLGFRVDAAEGYRDATVKLRTGRYRAVITDVNLGPSDGIQLLRWTKERFPQLPVIMLTGYGNVETAVESMKLGASDYLLKPVAAEQLQATVGAILGRTKSLAREEPRQATRSGTDEQFARMIGRDEKMLRLRETIECVADSQATTLILGESGTGKTMTARAIHALSPRRDKPFVEFSCGALAETLLESELFGHVSGAFTGAVQDRDGKFRQADGGTLFLDEIGTASPALQVKLLRAIQDREFEPVGSSRTHRVDVRLIFATNHDLEQLVRQGSFREDLFFRINVVTIHQPPLRERTEDIPLLVENYLQSFNLRHGRMIERIDPRAMQALIGYSWPGNVRELMNVVERMVVLSRGVRISVEDLPEAIRPSRLAAGVDGPSPGTPGIPLKAALAHPERDLIVQALDEHDWNRQATAQALGINRTTLYKKMKKYGIRYEHERHFA